MTKQIKSKKTSKTQSVKELAASLREIADEWAGTPVHCDYQNHPLRPLMLEAYHSALGMDPCTQSTIVESVNEWGGQHFEATSKRIEPPDNETGLRSLRLQKAAIVLLNMLERLKRQDYGDKGESAELRQIADALAPEGKDAEPDGAALTSEAKALALLVEHPDWTDTKIAKNVPCSRQTLYAWPTYRKARGIQESGKDERPHGSKSKDGNLEAWNTTNP